MRQGVQIHRAAAIVFGKVSVDVTSTSFLTFNTCKLNKIWDSRSCFTVPQVPFWKVTSTLATRLFAEFWNKHVALYYSKQENSFGSKYRNFAYNVAIRRCSKRSWREWACNSFSSWWSTEENIFGEIVAASQHIPWIFGSLYDCETAKKFKDHKHRRNPDHISIRTRNLTNTIIHMHSRSTSLWSYRVKESVTGIINCMDGDIPLEKYIILPRIVGEFWDFQEDSQNL